jgi:Uma2 family endonuclease
MADPARKLATWEDILRAPEGMKAEVLGGELELFPRPRPRHGRAQSVVARVVGGPFDVDDDGPGGWWIVIEPDIELGPHDIVSPDVCGWRRERLPELPESGPIRLRPDWVCEVLSPSTSRRDRTRKADLYARAEIPYSWILDPGDRTLEAFQNRAGSWVRLGGWSDGDAARIAPFDAIEIQVGRSFQPART